MSYLVVFIIVIGIIIWIASAVLQSASEILDDLFGLGQKGAAKSKAKRKYLEKISREHNKILSDLVNRTTSKVHS